MTAPLPFTGERSTPEISGASWHEHWHRYRVALRSAKGKRVLDAAGAEAYGSGQWARAPQWIGDGNS